MLLTGVLLALVGVAFWLYCLIDLLLTPSESCRYLPKLTWVAVVAVVFGFGGAAWLLLGRPGTSGPVWRNALRAPRPATAGGGWISRIPGWKRRGGGLRRGAGYRQTRASRMDDARSRHPAGRARPPGPDDDPAFLRHLDDLIRGSQDIGND
jgi:Phospholipase_D-nuclease N-terminal